MTHQAEPTRDRAGRRMLAAAGALLVAAFAMLGVLIAQPAEAAEYGSNWKFQRVTVPGVTLPFKLSKIDDAERVVTGIGKGPYADAYPNGINIGKPNATDGEAGKPLAGKFGTLEGMGFAGYSDADGGTWTGVALLRTDTVKYSKFRSRGFKYGSLIGNASDKDVIAIEFIVTKPGDTLAEPPKADGMTFKIDRDGACGPHRLTLTFDKDKPLKPGEFIWMAMPKFDEDAGVQGAFIPKPAMPPKPQPAPGFAARDAWPVPVPTVTVTVDPTTPPGPTPTVDPEPTPTFDPDPTPTHDPDPTPTDTCPPYEDESDGLIEI